MCTRKFFLFILFIAFQNFSLAAPPPHKFKVTTVKGEGGCAIRLITVGQLIASPTKVDTFRLFTCTNCGTKDRISKPENKDGDRRCPGCAATFPADSLGATYSSSKLYPDHIYEDQLIPPEIKKAHYGKGNDWICPHCKGRNFAGKTQCLSCGKERENPTHTHDTPEAVAKPFNAKPYLLALALAAGGGGAIYMMQSSPYEAELDSSYWTRNIRVEKLETNTHSNWRSSIPWGAKNIRDCEMRLRAELNDMNKFLDHLLAKSELSIAKNYKSKNKILLAQINNGDGSDSWGGSTSSSGGGSYGGSSSDNAPPPPPQPEEWCTYDIDEWEYHTTISNSGYNPKSSVEMQYSSAAGYSDSKYRTFFEASNVWNFSYRDAKGNIKKVSTETNNEYDFVTKRPGDKATLNIRRIGTVAGKPEWH